VGRTAKAGGDNLEFLTPEQVADALQVTRRTVYTWIETGALKAVKAGARIRIRREDLDAFLEPVEPKGKKGKKGRSTKE